MDYRRTVVLEQPFGEAQALVRAALMRQGFGIVSEIDMARTLQTKIGAEIEPLVILGACNPALAHRAMQEEPSIGVLLPCNVVVRAHGEQTIVEAQDPLLLVELTGNPELNNLAREVSDLLEAALALVRHGERLAL